MRFHLTSRFTFGATVLSLIGTYAAALLLIALDITGGQLYSPSVAMALFITGLVVALSGVSYRRATLLTETSARHFTNIRAYLQEDSSVAEAPMMFRPGGYKWVDFESGYVFVNRDLVSRLEEKLATAPFVLLLGDAGTGKSTSALSLGFEMVSKLSGQAYYEDLSAHAYYPTDSLLDGIGRLAEDVARPHRTEDRYGLVILDNAHIEDDLVRTLYENRWRFGNRIRVLMIARPTSSDMAQEVHRWFELFQTQEEEEGDFHCVVMDDEIVETTMRNCIDKFASLYGLRVPSRSRRSLYESLERLAEKSLWTLALLMREMMLSSDHDLAESSSEYLLHYVKREQNLGETVGKYYDDVLSRILSVWPRLVPYSASAETIRIAYRRILSALAAMCLMELPMPKSALLESPQASDLFPDEWEAVTSPLLVALSDLGEVRVHDETLALPNHCLALQILQHFDPDSDWQTAVEEYTIDLIRYLTRTNRHVPLSRIAAFALNMRPSWDRMARFLESEAVSIVVSALQSDPGTIGPFLRYLRIMDSPKIGQEVAASLVRSAEPWKLVRALKECREMANNDSVLGAVSESIRRSELPLRIVFAVSGNETLASNPRIQTAIEESSSKIAKSLEDTRNAWLFLGMMTSNQSLMEKEVIRQAIAQAISKSVRPMLLLQILCEQRGMLEDKLIQNAAIRAAKRTDDPWMSLSLICSCLQSGENGKNPPSS